MINAEVIETVRPGLIGPDTTTPIIVDLDDYSVQNSCWRTLLDLRLQIPHFRVTLFTIPSQIPPVIVRGLLRDHGDWIDLVPHGWNHDTNYECLSWTYEYTKDKIRGYRDSGYTCGFKAPGWQISDGVYQALLEEGFWVADQPYNNHRRPPQLPVYLLDSPNKIHGHVGHLGGHNPNELNLILPTILARKDHPFAFVRDALHRP